jgi:hypothetical protein
LHHSTIRRSVSWLLALMLTLPLCANADDISYQYDENGRVIHAANHTTAQAVAYAYDEVGNILSQIVSPLSTLTLSYFSPSSGPVGSEVALTGTGFSITPASNTVSINGTAATVLSATESRLVVTVPVGATTGLISVQVGSSTVTSAQPFVVTAASAGPAIYSLTPAIGASGTSVVIAGVNFEPVSSNNRVRYSNSVAAITGTPTPASISTTVPANTGSGKVRVSTPRGVAISPVDFIVVPSGYSAASIGSTGRITMDAAPTSISVPTASKISIQLFDAAAGDLLSVGVNSTTLATATLKVYKPDGVLLASGAVTMAGQGLQLPKILTTGTYALVVDPGTNTGTISLSVLTPLVLSATLGGSPVTATLTPGGRRAIVNFSGGAGSYANVALSSVSLANGTVSLLEPEGELLASAGFTTTGKTISPLLPSTGSYSLLLEPTGSISGNATVTISSSASPTIAVNGSDYGLYLPTTTPVTFTFRGEAGQRLALGIVENGGGVKGANFTVFGPDGAQLATSAFTTTGCFGPGCGDGYKGTAVINLSPLATGGTYTVSATRTGTTDGTLQLTLTTPLELALTTNTSVNVSSIRAGQALRLTFAGNAAEYYSIAFIEAESNIPGASVSIVRPDGSELDKATLTASSLACPGSGCGKFGGFAFLNLEPLPASGSYEALVTQTKGGTGTLNVTLSTPKLQSLSADTPVNVHVNLPGQGIRFNFSGSANQYSALSLFEAQYGDIVGGVITVFASDGSLIGGNIFLPVYCAGFTCGGYSGDGAVQLGPMPVTDAYSAIFRQVTPATGTLTSTLASPASGSLTVGTASNISASLRGQPLQLTFNGVAGDVLSVGVEEVDAGDIEGATISVLRPDGTVLASSEFVPQFSTCGGFGCSGFKGTGVLNLGALPATGVYTLLVQQYGGDTGSLKITVSSPNVATLSVGTVTPVQAALAGQSLSLEFSGTSGQFLALAFEEEQYGEILGADISIIAPTGAVVATGTLTTSYGSCGGFGCAGYFGKGLVNFGPLPANGTYTALVRQTSGGKGTLKFTLSGAATGSLSPSTPQTVSASLLGQSIRAAFAGTAGAYVRLQASEAYGSHISGAVMRVFNPNGSLLATRDFSPTTCGGCNGYQGSASYDLPPLPVAGTYSVLLQQKTAGTGELTLTADGITPTSNTSWNISTTTAGQNATFTFTSAAGQNLALAVSGLTFSSGTNATVKIYMPSGPLLQSQSCSTSDGGCVLSMRGIPESGTYTVVVDPASNATMSFLATLTANVLGQLVAGTPVSLNLSQMGQNALLTFTATSGQDLALNWGSISTTPSGTNIGLYVYGPSGTQVDGDYTTTGQTLNLMNLTAGTHTVLVRPTKPATSALQVTLHTQVSGSLTSGVSSNFTTPAPGQNVYLSFEGTAGQNIAFAASSFAFSPNSTATVKIYRPDGAQLASDTCTVSNGCVFSLLNLPQSGTYTVLVNPGNHVTMSFVATVSQDVTGVLTAGTPVSLNLSQMGQNALLTFTATSGQDFALNWGSISTTPSGTNIGLYVYGPSGTQVDGDYTTTGQTLNLMNLTAGTHTVLVRPTKPATSALQVTLHTQVSGSLTSGVSSNFTTPAPGQNVYLSFEGTAGQNIAFAASSFAFSPNSTATVKIYRPDGAQLASDTCTVSNGCVFSLLNLPQSGTYTVLVNPGNHVTMSFVATVSQDVTGVLTAGTPVSLNLSQIGQNALYSFTVSAGQSIALTMSSISTTPSGTSVAMYVYRPDNSLLSSTSSVSSATLNLASLPAGTYSVLIRPTKPATTTLQLGY